MQARVIFHVDLNAFFASASQIQDPSLQGKPIVICRQSRGAVVTTASYEARVYGIHSAMPLSIARSKYPQLIVVEPNFELYASLSQQFYELLLTFSPLVEKASIDECYIDVTEKIQQYNKPLNLAVEIQQTIKNDLGLSCSIGVGPNKFLAKMASDMQKPMGITVLRKREVESKLWPLKIEDMHGIGKKSQALLKRLNIKTIGDLAKANKKDLETVFLNQVDDMIQRAYGEDTNIVEVDNDVKSISASNSLYEGLGDYEDIHALLSYQCQDIAYKMKRDDVFGLTLTLSISFNQNKNISKSKRLEQGFHNYNDLLTYSLYLFDEFEFKGEVTYLSVGLSNLKKNYEEDAIYNLFNFNKSKNSVDEIIKTVNHLFDENVLKTSNELLNSGNKDE